VAIERINKTCYLSLLRTVTMTEIRPNNLISCNRMRLYLFALICLLFIGCKKNDPGNNLIGYWDIVKFTIGGIDTTAYIKSDSIYGYTRFFLDEHNTTYVSMQALHSSNFIDGLWDLVGSRLSISWYYSHPIGPYLKRGVVNWQIKYISQDMIDLFIIDNNLECNLIYRRVK
jgi:hypothetical protein